MTASLIRKDGKPWGGPVQPHAVYRMYDSDGNLLYIGCTVDITTRLRSHMGGRALPWMPQVARIELEWYPDFAEAREAERHAIADEDPPRNISGKS